MSFTRRPYRHPQDYERLVGFLSRARADIARSHYLHVGDLTWQLFHMLAGHSPADLVQMWEGADGALLGFALLYPAYGFFDLQVHPEQRGGALESDMLAWAERALPTAVGRATLVNDSDTIRLGLVAGQGYAPQGEWRYMERPLNGPLPALDGPAGLSIRSVASDDEAAARAEVLAAAFGAPPQPERYRQLMGAPGYTRDLDIVAVAPDGRFAAFALCWVDEGSKTGQFEPVGTAPAFRRRGAAQAVLYEGLRRMRRRGAERAIVIVEAEEQAACRLYEAVGFEHRWGLTLYGRAGA